MSEVTSHVHSCFICGTDFDTRFPGTSVLTKGPAHASCIATRLETAEAKLDAIEVTVNDYEGDGGHLATMIDAILNEQKTP